MANTKISDLPGTTTLTDEDAIPVVQEGVTKKITGVLTALKTLLGIGNPETLQTQSKQVVGAVNELNGKTDGLEELLDSSSQVPGVTSGEKFVGYSNLYKFGSLYVLDILVVANNGYAVNDVVASLPVTVKNNIAAGRFLASSNGAAMQIVAIGNQVTAQNSNPTPGTYGGIVMFVAD